MRSNHINFNPENPIKIGGFTQTAEHFFQCDTCGKELESGIASISGHWSECSGEGYLKLIDKIQFKNIPFEEKMKEVRQIFSL